MLDTNRKKYIKNFFLKRPYQLFFLFFGACSIISLISQCCSPGIIIIFLYQQVNCKKLYTNQAYSCLNPSLKERPAQLVVLRKSVAMTAHRFYLFVLRIFFRLLFLFIEIFDFLWNGTVKIHLQIGCLMSFFSNQATAVRS